MRTTSHPPSRSRSKSGSVPQGSPLKSIRLTLTLTGPRSERLERAAAEEGFTVEEEGGGLSLGFTASTAEEALERLSLLAGLLSQKG